MALGDELLRLRTESGLTQAELAKKAGISRAYLSLVEAGRRGVTPEGAAQLADALRLTGVSRNNFVAAAAMTQGAPGVMELLVDARAKIRFLSDLCGIGVPPMLNETERKRYGAEVAEKLAALRRANQRLYDQLQEKGGSRKPPRFTPSNDDYPEIVALPAQPLPRQKGRPPRSARLPE